jgi:hypothetical protein
MIWSLNYTGQCRGEHRGKKNINQQQVRKSTYVILILHVVILVNRTSLRVRFSIIVVVCNCQDSARNLFG